MNDFERFVADEYLKIYGPEYEYVFVDQDVGIFITLPDGRVRAIKPDLVIIEKSSGIYIEFVACKYSLRERWKTDDRDAMAAKSCIDPNINTVPWSLIFYEETYKPKSKKKGKS